MSPLVTAIIPCHNHARWVTDAVLSVARQDYLNKKIIVVDDGSTDKSMEAVVDLLFKPRSGQASGLPGQPVFWSGKMTHENVEVMVLRYASASGPSFARNRGVDIAVNVHNAELFAFLDSDDLYEPGKLSKSVAKIVEAPEHIGAVYTDFDTLRPDGLRIRQFKEPFSRRRLLQECIVNCDSVVSRKAWEAVGGFDEKLRVSEDFDWWQRASERFLIVHVPESLLTIRLGNHSSTDTVPKEVWASCWQRVAEKTRSRAHVKN